MVVHLPDVFWVFMLYVYTSQSVSQCLVSLRVEINPRGVEMYQNALFAPKPTPGAWELRSVLCFFRALAEGKPQVHIKKVSWPS